MSELDIVNKINAEFNNKVRRRPVWSRTELFELHKNVCNDHLNPVRRKNLARLNRFYDDVN
tara:strand:+ start:1406 stop:1588 length:183 start_codon:yes stop_codon:yes gene_type:complete